MARESSPGCCSQGDGGPVVAAARVPYLLEFITAHDGVAVPLQGQRARRAPGLFETVCDAPTPRVWRSSAAAHRTAIRRWAVSNLALWGQRWWLRCPTCKADYTLDVSLDLAQVHHHLNPSQLVLAVDGCGWAGRPCIHA